MSTRTITVLLFAAAAVIAAALLVHLGLERMRDAERSRIIAEQEQTTERLAPRESKSTAKPTSTPSATTTTASARTTTTSVAPDSVASMKGMPIREALPRFGFGDADDDMHPSVFKFVVWSNENSKWHDFFPGPSETSAALAKKDMEEARGKKLCVSGRIGEIAVIRSQKISVKMTSGWMTSKTGGDRFSFATAFDSGDLVQNSAALFCGYVVGTRYFSNVSGGTTATIQLVGMFDLPSTHPAGEPPVAR